MLLGDEVVEIRMGSPTRLDALLQFMTENLGTRYQYSADIGSKPVSIQTPTKLPKKALPFLLSSVLKSENLAIVEGDAGGEKRIIQSVEMAKYAPIGERGDAEKIFQEKGAGAPATQVFALKKLTPESLMILLQQFSPSSIRIAVPNSNILVVTDYANNLKKIDDLVTMIDSPVGETVYKFYEVKNQASKDLTEQVQLIFGQKDASAPEGGQAPGPARSIRLFDDAKGNRIVVVGRTDLVDEALALLKQFDVELGMKTTVYRPKNLSAERLNKIVEGYLPEQDVKRAYQGTVDEDGNLLIVRATVAIHQQVQALLEELDKTTAATDSPIRIYKLKNARANEVLFTLLALQEAYGAGMGGLGGLGGNSFFGGAFGGLGIPGFSNGLLGNTGFGGMNAFGSGFGMGGMGGMGGFGGMGQFGNQGVITEQLPLQPGQPTMPGSTTGAGGGGTGNTAGGRGQRNQITPNGGGLAAGGSASLPGGARVSADVGTNSLIVVAPASIQPVYQKLIESLDTRRPQVMIEAKLIAVDTTDGFTLGIETAGGDREGAVRAFKFTSYGLSTVSANGNLALTPGRGFNGTIVDPEVADIVVRALANHSRSRVLSEPKLLVNDNDTGTLTSVVSVPFSSVNASNTVSTTSLGGTQEAGTTITVTPQINEDDNLQLEFEIEFSSFSGSGTATLPPARQIQTVSSVITIPDGQTVIVGGLKRIGARQEYAGIPWIEKIPLIRDLTGRTDESKETTSYFVFIRPLIVRDSRFEDLQFISDRDAGLAGIPSGYPGSQPLLMR
jgi:type II secretory pathway component GspD/PulD (secretin)